MPPLNQGPPLGRTEECIIFDEVNFTGDPKSAEEVYAGLRARIAKHLNVHFTRSERGVAANLDQKLAEAARRVPDIRPSRKTNQGKVKRLFGKSCAAYLKASTRRNRWNERRLKAYEKLQERLFTLKFHACMETEITAEIDPKAIAELRQSLNDLSVETSGAVIWEPDQDLPPIKIEIQRAPVYAGPTPQQRFFNSRAKHRH